MTHLRKTILLKAATAMAVGSMACLPGAAAARDVTVSHARGETVLRATPAKVAVYDLATLDILNALGVDAVAGVPKGADGKGNFPSHIARYADAQYRNVGTLFEPDMAALTALQPDLIIIGGRSTRKYDEVAGIAPTIDMSSPNKDLAATTIDNVRKLGRLFGVEKRADQRIAAFEGLMADLHAQAAGAGTGLLLFGAGQNLSVHAPGDRFGHVYDFVGIRSAVPPAAPAATEPRPAAGSPEAAAARARQQQALADALMTDPTWIFVIDRAAATGDTPSTIAERLAADERVAATSAWKAGRVIYLDPRNWYLVGAGVDALSQSATAIRAALRDFNI